MRRISLLECAHEVVAASLNDGGIAVDATTGNGHDTLFLAGAVGDYGRVYGFDIQRCAIENTRKRLADAGLLERVVLFQTSHAGMLRALPSHTMGRVGAVMFNLGYLPGSDKSTITRHDSTLQAVGQACELLKNGGVLSILAYPGHAGGEQELSALLDWLDTLDRAIFDCRTMLATHPTPRSPRLFVIRKRA